MPPPDTVDQLNDLRLRVDDLERLIHNTIASLAPYSDRLDALEELLAEHNEFWQSLLKLLDVDAD